MDAALLVREALEDLPERVEFQRGEALVPESDGLFPQVRHAAFAEGREAFYKLLDELLPRSPPGLLIRQDLAHCE